MQNHSILQASRVGFGMLMQVAKAPTYHVICPFPLLALFDHNPPYVIDRQTDGQTGVMLVA